MCSLQFPNGEIVYTHLWNGIDLNNGLKNKFAEAKAMNNEVLIQKYVSTTYFVLALIFVPLMILLLIANTFIDWCSWLNVSFLLNEQLQIIMPFMVEIRL